ncbi:unnamed protein product [Lymnaea stagnalis]|uniref:Integrin alpha-2 domain-containing protein n=1 Tax=Lymnaea stagnalis TaxID=6523 RepID=A0AAV2HIV7_LYMST
MGIVNESLTLLISIYLCNLLNLSDGINLDASFSVLKKGFSGSYFGFSVAQHQILSDDDNAKLLENLILVGAPKEIRPLGSNKTSGGALYKCSLTENAQEKCSYIVDGVSTVPAATETIDDQWLGVTMASSGPGKKVVACAHRYIKDKSAPGVCFVFPANLQDPVDQYRPCEKQSHTRFMEDFGLCQAGMSAAVGQDDALIMGAPGSLIWQGAMFLTNITDELGASTTEIVSPYFGDVQAKAENKQVSPTGPYALNGYSVTMGRFDSSKVLYYVTGSPKSNNKGEIVFFKQHPKGTLRYEPEHIVKGALDFSGFGTSLLAVDLNQDGFDDLVVGAPYYFSKNRGGAIYIYSGGREMISKNSKPLEILSREMTALECEQLMCEHALFGMSLSKLGDINMDGYQDLAVGAPYEGKGAVYIYHGAAKISEKYVQRITASELQLPNIRSFGYSLSGGLDLDQNGYPDLVVGAYESDTVALIRSRPIIKISPKLSVSPKAVDLEAASKACASPGVKLEFKHRLCVEIKLCLSFTTLLTGRSSTSVDVTYKLEAEPTRRVSRVELQDAQDVGKKVIDNRTVSLQANAEKCVTEIALLKDQFDDKLNPMEFRFSFGLSTDKEKAPPYPSSSTVNINGYPVLDTDGSLNEKPNSVSVEAEFVMECGEDNKCSSNLQFNAELKDLTKNSDGVHELVISGSNQLHVEMRLSNEGEPAYLTKVYVMKPKAVTYLGTDTQVNLYFLFKDSVACQSLKDNDNLIMCDQIGNPLRTGRNTYFILRLNVPTALSETDELYSITAWVNTSSKDETPLNDLYDLKFRVINRADIYVDATVAPDSPILCKGEPREAQDLIDESNIGASVTHNFVVRNAGPGVVAESYITIRWPYEVAGPRGGPGKYLLYLMEMPKPIGPVLKCNDITEFINPLDIKKVLNEPAAGASLDPEGGDSEDNKSVRRRKRQAEKDTRASGTVVVMSCQDSEKVKCFELKCQLGKLEPNVDFVKFTFKARLWESTLLSDYRSAAEVQIISWANLTVPDKLRITQPKENDVKIAITRAVPDIKETAGGQVQWWIILVAVLIGLVVLLVVIFVLYKLGFFRRKRMEDMHMYKAEKKQQAMLDDYENNTTN